MIAVCRVCEKIMGTCEPKNVAAIKRSICDACREVDEERGKEKRSRGQEFWRGVGNK